MRACVLSAPGDLDAVVVAAGLELAFDLHGRSVPFLVECRGRCGMGYGLGAPGDLDAFVAVASLDAAFDLHGRQFPFWSSSKPSLWSGPRSRCPR